MATTKSSWVGQCLTPLCDGLGTRGTGDHGIGKRGMWANRLADPDGDPGMTRTNGGYRTRQVDLHEFPRHEKIWQYNDLTRSLFHATAEGSLEGWFRIIEVADFYNRCVPLRTHAFCELHERFASSTKDAAVAE